MKTQTKRQKFLFQGNWAWPALVGFLVNLLAISSALAQAPGATKLIFSGQQEYCAGGLGLSPGTTSIPKPTQGKGYDIGFKADGDRISGTLTFFDIRNLNIVNDLAVTDSRFAFASIDKPRLSSTFCLPL